MEAERNRQTTASGRRRLCSFEHGSPQAVKLHQAFGIPTNPGKMRLVNVDDYSFREFSTDPL